MTAAKAGQNDQGEETLRRHATKPNRDDFGEEDLCRWWMGKDLT